ncbi:hypothetical protein BBO99_00006486 [Phytophthora kernoviae]|uniref:sn-1-specific diacylglycerol lipase n=2 Tax=Phytophthora kernoviae TaxID=325452 RepID=A0A421FJL7_9STRA|nr:hypothetical protein G195_008835 [Phytophthora kernoviae 00238/432]KAG2520074.1 hypothetical protein JM18_007288 [Phytophthora kernoviae]RLN45898.1 hypothetical protein BBI17_006551 [Phytophthora kernoviae]RLN77770.1 hypothetical protein BBO99_00006486 [Phytophthora kernoviae]
MEGRRTSAGGEQLSWSEVQEICGQMESMFHEDALKDAQRLRALVQKRKDIADTFQNRQSTAQKQLAHLRANLREWEEQETAAKLRNEQVYKRLQELETIKRDMAESLDALLIKYEEARQELVQYNTAHQNDIPLAKNQMSLYAAVTGIRWNFSGSQIAGDIHVPAKQRIVRFEFDPATDHFTAANALWDKIDEAFDDDPPPWCTARQEVCPSKDEQKEFNWQIYRGEDYDEEGWLYGDSFQDTLGPKTRSSVVRTRVWMELKPDKEKEEKQAATEASEAKENSDTAVKGPEWSTLFPSEKKNDKTEDEVAKTEDNSVSETKEDDAAGGTLVAAKSAPIGAAAKMAVVSADFLRKYGKAGLLGFILRNEFMQSFSTLKGLIGDLDDLGFQDAAIGTYYFMAMNRGERGADPEGEQVSHQGCEPVSDEVLAKMLKYAPLALHGIYELDVLDIQRISKLQGFSLIYAHTQGQDVRHPSFALLGSKENKTALVLIRGSKSVQDMLTDIQANPEDIGLSSAGAPHNETAGGFVDAFAHNGMLKAAMWIKDRIVKSLRALHNEGYHIVFAGHSLGAGCAALLSVMLQKEFEDLECFAYAVPACVNLSVADSCNDFVHSIVLRDDFVPRAKASNVLKLVEELKNFKGCWRDTASEDIEAFKERAKTLWAPRKREWAKEEADMKKGKLANRDKLVDLKKAAEASLPEGKATADEKITKPDGKEDHVSSWTLTRTNLIDQLDKVGEQNSEEKALEPLPEKRLEEEKVIADLATNLTGDPKELYIPGEVTHLYYYKGIYEAVRVDRKCEELSHIPVQQNMLNDHLGRNYLNALRIVRDARRSKPTLPEWVPFSTKTRCMCCDSPFTWNSTSSSEAQQNRDQHNCRRCGCLVCEGCSEKLKSIPEYGIHVPVRVCDRCYYEL